MPLYFAYGSNLDAAQMTTRCPSAKLIAPATLSNYRLAFAGQSALWGGAVATVIRSKGSDVEGLIWYLDPHDLAQLDRYEGHPWAYRRKRLLIWLDEQRRQVQVYVKPKPQVARPSLAYFQIIHRAYRRHSFNLQPLIQAAGAAQ